MNNTSNIDQYHAHKQEQPRIEHTSNVIAFSALLCSSPPLGVIDLEDFQISHSYPRGPDPNLQLPWGAVNLRMV